MKKHEIDAVIAKYLGIRHETQLCPIDGDKEYTMVKVTPNANWQVAHYSTSMDWLYPVYIKLRKELLDFINDNIASRTHDEMFRWHTGSSIKVSIELALISGSISELHSEIVKGINFINEQNK